MQTNVLSTDRARANWDAVSSRYAQTAHLRTEPFADAIIERLDVDSSMAVLEVAAGAGAVTMRLAPRAKSVLATDFSPKMVDLLRQRAQAAGLRNVTCEVMDGQALSVDDARFDRAVCAFALMTFPDRAKGFSELRRALRPGGRAVVSGWAGPQHFELFALFRQAKTTAFADMPPPPGPPPVLRLADPADFAEQMQAAGFTDVQVDPVAREIEVDSFEALWAMLSTSVPAQALLGSKGADGENRLREALAAVVTRRYGNGMILLHNTATIGSGVAPVEPACYPG